MYLTLIAPHNLVADLVVWNLDSTGIQPFQFGRSYEFTYIVGNVGNAIAQNIRARVYLGNEFMGSMMLGSISPGQAFIFTFNFSLPSGINMGGRLEMAIAVSTTSHETNLANNRTSTFFTWPPAQGTVDLTVIQIHSNNGLGNDVDFTAAEFQDFSASIANLGNVTANNAFFRLLVDNRHVISGYLPPIPPNRSLEVSWSLRVGRSGNYSFYANLRDHLLLDTNLNNNSRTRVLRALPDGCGRMASRFVGDARNVSVGIINEWVHVNEVQAAVNAWRNISSNVDIPVVGHNLQNPTVTVDIGELPFGVYGSFVPNSNNTFTGGRVTLSPMSTTAIHMGITNSDFRMRVLKHEFGHLFGLGHPCYTSHGSNYGNVFCQDPSIMRADTRDLPPTITEHDRRALIMIFGS